MRIEQLGINIRRAALIFIVGSFVVACSEKSALKKGNDANTSETETAQDADDQQPDKDQIEENCAAFVRSTKVLSPKSVSTDCPGCPAGGMPVLAFRGMNTDAVSCSGDTCFVVVTIRAVYTAGSGERIAGGLTAWLTPEQRAGYLNGQIPAGEQAYRVQIVYKRRGAAWSAVEFDRAPAN